MVVDASFALRLLVPGPDAEIAHRHWAGWIQTGTPLLAPDYWAIEIASGLRRLQVAGELTTAEVDVLLARVFEIGVQLLPVDLEIVRSALRWANRLDQGKAYDGLYLAFAEVAGGELWTADLRLVRRARQIGLGWVHGLGE